MKQFNSYNDEDSLLNEVMTLKSESTALSGDEERDFSECSEHVYLLTKKE